VHDGVEPVIAVVDPRQCPRSLAEVGEVDARERRPRVRRWDAIKVRDLVVVGQQLVDHRPAELAAPTSHRDTHPAPSVTLAERRAS
jgi:hypothetical protein